MNNTRLCLATVALALSTGLSPGARAAESYDACTGFITTLPATIATQGVWCMNSDLSTAITSGAAITVATNNVTIDCNNFKLGGLAAGAGTNTFGVRSTSRLNTVVRNCNIRGFFVGVTIDGEATSGHVIENNRFEANTYGGIGVNAVASTIRGNLVIDTGGSTLQNQVAGIIAYGQVDVIDNTIDGVQPAEGSDGSGVGIGLANAGGGSITGNRIRNIGYDGAGGYYGINANFSGPVVIAGNQLIGTGLLTESDNIGIACISPAVRLRDNSINSFPVPVTNCGDGGNNDIYGELP